MLDENRLVWLETSFDLYKIEDVLKLNFLAINNARLSELKRITLRDENRIFPDVGF